MGCLSEQRCANSPKQPVSVYWQSFLKPSVRTNWHEKKNRIGGVVHLLALINKKKKNSTQSALAATLWAPTRRSVATRVLARRQHAGLHQVTNSATSEL